MKMEVKWYFLNKNNEAMNENTYRLIKSIFMAILLYVLYMWAQNGRYATVGNSPAVLIDKWNQEALMLNGQTGKYEKE